MSAPWADARRLIDEAVAEAAFPGAALIVASGDRVLHELYAGRLEADGAEVSARTIYDLSSLTKPLATLSATLLLIARGGLRFEDRVADLAPELLATGEQVEARASITVEDLLRHRSGLPAVRPYWRRLADERPEAVATAAGRATVVGYALAESLECLPRTRATYSDIGFIILGDLIERIAGCSLERFVTEQVLAPLGVRDTTYGAPSNATHGAHSDWYERVAPCGSCAWRGGTVRGVVQDENAHAMGGVAGHAGLFGTARDVYCIVAAYVAAADGDASLFAPALVRRCWQRDGASDPPASTWAIGWDTPTPGVSSAGTSVSATAVGHLGYTGTSIWVDRERGVQVILLTNRLHPDRENVAVRRVRPRLHDAVFAAVDSGARRAC